jgi:hypothetical protein
MSKVPKVSKSACSLLLSYPFSLLEAFAFSCVSIHNEFLPKLQIKKKEKLGFSSMT